ncbi:MAG: hypothetical protein Edafosvirus16_11 [Edafosvirus sp.]|uniref:Uncharacterized protein n=1 Tax=Edafosvirus sp. TaxID=2487765 RepID=A0A3G4ZUD1_9VIRU|nr:MAG: hypothetical protein Edafosvirus16_11 [Edafosvirus sp.]
MSNVLAYSKVAVISEIKKGTTLSESKIVPDDQRLKAIAELEACIVTIKTLNIDPIGYDSFYKGKQLSEIIEICQTGLAEPKIKESSMVYINYLLLLLRLQVDNLPKITELYEMDKKLKDECDLVLYTQLRIGKILRPGGAQVDAYVTVETKNQSEDNQLKREFVTTVYKDTVNGKELLTTCWHGSDDAAKACHMHYVNLINDKDGHSMEKINWMTQGALSSHNPSVRPILASPTTP